jgi:peptidoglycan hydrolase CwlO-like protein
MRFSRATLVALLVGSSVPGTPWESVSAFVIPKSPLPRTGPHRSILTTGQLRSQSRWIPHPHGASRTPQARPVTPTSWRLYANNDSNNNKLQGDIQAAEDELRAIEEEIRKAQESAKSGPAAADKDQSNPKSTEPKADNTVLAGTGLFLPLVTVAASRFVVAQKERREEAEEQARLEKEQELRAKQLAAAQAGAGAGPIAVPGALAALALGGMFLFSQGVGQDAATQTVAGSTSGGPTSKEVVVAQANKLLPPPPSADLSKTAQALVQQQTPLLAKGGVAISPTDDNRLQILQENAKAAQAKLDALKSQQQTAQEEAKKQEAKAEEARIKEREKEEAKLAAEAKAEEARIKAEEKKEEARLAAEAKAEEASGKRRYSPRPVLEYE